MPDCADFWMKNDGFGKENFLKETELLAVELLAVEDIFDVALLAHFVLYSKRCRN